MSQDGKFVGFKAPAAPQGQLVGQPVTVTGGTPRYLPEMQFTCNCCPVVSERVQLSQPAGGPGATCPLCRSYIEIFVPFQQVVFAITRPKVDTAS